MTTLSTDLVKFDADKFYPLVQKALGTKEPRSIYFSYGTGNECSDRVHFFALSKAREEGATLGNETLTPALTFVCWTPLFPQHLTLRDKDHVLIKEFPMEGEIADLAMRATFERARVNRVKELQVWMWEQLENQAHAELLKDLEIS